MLEGKSLMSKTQNKPNDYLRCIHRGKNTGSRIGG